MGRTTPIAPVLERLGIQARRSGREWVARCPNPEHDDRHPSWRIRDEPGTDRHGLHHCWSCGFSGGVVGLVSEVLGVEPREARAWLGDDEATPAAAPPPPAVRVEVARPGRFRMPAGVEFGPLAAWLTPPRRYAEARGITSAQVDRWGLGYAVEGRLAGRIVVPYRAPGSGEPRGYTARAFGSHPKRYKEADHSEGADRAAMFGEQHWPVRGWDRGLLYVTEGALNALAVERALPGADIAAIAGSGLRAAHAAKIATFAELVVLTDPDAAGDKAAGEIEAAAGRHARVVRVRLPEGKDAADLSAEMLREIIDATTEPDD